MSDADELRWLEIRLRREPLGDDAGADARLARLEALVIYLAERCDSLSVGWGERLEAVRARGKVTDDALAERIAALEKIIT